MRFRDGPVAISVLIAFSFWLFVALPIYYGPPNNQTAEQCSAEENKQHGFWEKTRCDPVAFFTAWLVGFTGVLAVSTIGLWIVTWRSGVRQARDMEGAIAAAVAANQLSRDIFVATERPWVTLENLFVGPLEVTKDFARLQIRVVPKNRGKSPAVGVTPHARLVLLRGKSHPGLGLIQKQLIQEASAPTGYTFGASILSEGETLQIPTNQTLSVSREEMNNVVPSGGFVEAAIVGIIDYGFMFEQGRHYTPFCLHGVMIPVVEGKTPSIAGLVHVNTEISST